MNIILKNDIINLDVKPCIKADNTYICNSLNMFNELLKLIDFEKTIYQIKPDFHSIIFFLSDNICIEFIFNFYYTYDYTVYIHTAFSNELMSISYYFIEFIDICYIDIVTNIKDKIGHVRDFYNKKSKDDYNIYLKSLKSAFMRTY